MKKLKKRIFAGVLAWSLVVTMVSTMPVRAEGNDLTAIKDSVSTYVPTMLENGGFEEEFGDGINVNGSYNGHGWGTTDTWFERSNDPDTYGVVPPANGEYFLEMNADHPAVLYQDLTTVGGDVIRWTLQHAARCIGDDQQTMKVYIGEPDGENPSGTGSDINEHIKESSLVAYEAEGITNPAGGNLGYANTEDLVGLAVESLYENNLWHDARGIYVVPEGQAVTRFAFISTCADNQGLGNLMDNLTFSTLIGNLRAAYQTDGSVIVTGYWGDENPDKKLVIKIGETIKKVDMSDVVGGNFSITIPENVIGTATQIEAYHEDYEEVKRIVNINIEHKKAVVNYYSEGKLVKTESDVTGNATPPVVTKTGYVLEGWHVGSTRGEKWDFSNSVTSDMNLYAKWAANNYTVSYNANGGKNAPSSQTATYGKDVVLSSDKPEKFGYKFLGWSEEKLDVQKALPELNAWKAGAIVSKPNWKYIKGAEVTLYAVWGKTQNKIIYSTGGGAGSSTQAQGSSVSVCPKDSTCPIEPFTDTENKEWWHDGVHYCVENGLMIGVKTNVFAPNRTITRAMIVTMLWRQDNSPAVDETMSFKDVKSGEWYTQAIQWAQSTGVVTGYSHRRFGPNDSITREQLATILYRYADYKGIDVSNLGDISGYSDAGSVSGWAQKGMQWVYKTTLVNGRTDTELVPTATATRAEAATMMQRYCERILAL